MAAVLAVGCVCCGPYRLLCGGGVPCGGKHIIIIMFLYMSSPGPEKLRNSPDIRDVAYGARHGCTEPRLDLGVRNACTKHTPLLMGRVYAKFEDSRGRGGRRGKGGGSSH